MASILMIASGDRRYREYACASIAGKHSLVLLDTAEATWQRPYVAEALRVNLDDADVVIETTRGLRVDGVLTYDETKVQLAAELAAELGVAHLSVGAAGRCRDKLATRRALARAGVPSARAHHV